MNLNLKNKIQSITFAAMLLALFLLLRFIFKNINIIFGYSIQIQILIFVLASYLIKNKITKFLFFILAPILMLVQGFESNPIFDYLFYTWSFWPFYIFGSKKINNLILMFILSFIQCWVWNTISGILFYSATLKFSLIYNLIFNLWNFIFICPIYLVLNKLIFKRVLNEKILY